MKICGVYKITNKETGKFYIGSSVDIRQRWYAHKSKLRRGVHSNQHLQILEQIWRGLLFV